MGKMPFSKKYATPGESEYQPGSRHKVLKNLLGITRVREIDNVELTAYMNAERHLLSLYGSTHRFSSKDVREIHRIFLGSIYQWAGNYRTVNLSKGEFAFAFAKVLPDVMIAFEKEVLIPNTPCVEASLSDVAEKIAVVHVEFLLIHPFREGNGRTARLLATLMAYQAGLPGIDFDFIGGRGKQFNNYIVAVQAGLDRNYQPMNALVLRALRRALKLAGRA